MIFKTYSEIEHNKLKRGGVDLWNILDALVKNNIIKYEIIKRMCCIFMEPSIIMLKLYWIP